MRKIELASKAYIKYIRISPRKVRTVIDLVRGEKVGSALAVLENVNKRAKTCVLKALKSAIHNATVNPVVKAEELFISKINADTGPMLKRYRAAAMGRAAPIRHRTTHLAIELSKSAVEKPRAKKKKIQKREVKR